MQPPSLPPIDPNIAAAMRAPDPRLALGQAFAQWSGLSPLQLGALGATLERTLDPDALGGFSIRLAARMVLTPHGPKITIEGDSDVRPA